MLRKGIQRQFAVMQFLTENGIPAAKRQYPYEAADSPVLLNKNKVSGVERKAK